MDKRVVLAVAGSGKTTHIVDRIDPESRALVVTYTNSNFANLRQKVAAKFGYLPENVCIYTYFQFLYKFCYKPFLHDELGTRGINFDPCKNKYAKGLDRYIDRGGRLYSNRVAKLLEQRKMLDLVSERISTYFDLVCIDEIQDLAGHDFNLLPTVVGSDAEILFVGDFFQHTFDTSRDGNINSKLHDDYQKYLARFGDMGLEVDTDTLRKSYRCSPTICDFVTNNIGIEIESHRTDETSIQHVEDEEQAGSIFDDPDIVKLFYQQSNAYSCYGVNWGQSKGEDRYQDVAVVLNPTTYRKFSQDLLVDLNGQTKNRLYVACTRTRGNMYLVPEAIYKNRKS